MYSVLNELYAEFVEMYIRIVVLRRDLRIKQRKPIAFFIVPSFILVQCTSVGFANISIWTRA